MPIHWRPMIDVQEDNKLGRHDDRPICRACKRPIRDDNWRGGPMQGYLCSTCDWQERMAAALTREILQLHDDVREDDLRHDADAETDEQD